MDYTTLSDLLSKHKQLHVLNFWNDLSEKEKQNLSKQIESIDFDLFDNFRNRILNTTKASVEEKQHLETADIISLKERETKDDTMIKLGEEVIRNGKVAVFLVAGGQGSRLGFDGPKGVFPITPVKRKSLFQLHAEKIVAISKYYKAEIPWLIMTSDSNHEDTVKFFQENNFFGIKKENVLLFKQQMIPAVDQNGNLILSEKDQIFMNPNGHGGSLKAVWDSAAIDFLKTKKIEHLFYFQVDNVLTYICDPAFLGYHKQYKSEMSSKVIRKAYPEEKVGVICKINGKTGVVEYSNLSEENTTKKDENGELMFWAGSIAIHIIDVDFIELENKKGFKLPYHIAKKEISKISSDGLNKENIKGYKFETFIFDALLDCKNTISIEVERNEEFSPVKNASGVDSAETAKADLNRLYASWLNSAGKDIATDKEGYPYYNLEISPLFAFKKEQLIEKKKQIPDIKSEFYLE